MQFFTFVVLYKQREIRIVDSTMLSSKRIVVVPNTALSHSLSLCHHCFDQGCSNSSEYSICSHLITNNMTLTFRLFSPLFWLMHLASNMFLLFNLIEKRKIWYRWCESVSYRAELSLCRTSYSLIWQRLLFILCLSISVQ